MSRPKKSDAFKKEFPRGWYPEIGEMVFVRGHVAGAHRVKVTGRFGDIIRVARCEERDLLKRALNVRDLLLADLRPIPKPKSNLRKPKPLSTRNAS